MRAFRSLKSKVLITTAIVLVAMVGTANYLTYRFWKRQVISMVRQEAVVIARALEGSLESAMMGGAPEKVDAILESARGAADVVWARVIGADGTIKASTRAVEVGSPAGEGFAGMLLDGEPRVEVDPGGELGGSVLLFLPVRNRPRCQSCHDPSRKTNGFVELQLAMGEAFRPLATLRNYTLILSGVTVLALFGALGLLFRLEVTRPMSAILKTLDAAKRGDLTARVPDIQQDELGAIAENLNAMLRELKRNADEIESLHRKELRKSQRLAAIGQLAAGIAHEIKNPLAGIRASIQLFQEDLPVAHKGKVVLERIVAQIDRLDAAVRDLLTYARPPKPMPRPCDVNELVDRALQLALLEPSGSDIEVIREYQKGLPHAWLDPELMQQAFLNVIQNAIQAMPSGGKLVVRTWRDGPFLEVAFSDTGVGIPEDNLDQVFKPFFTTKHKGTGLGLSITQNIVVAHGGEIEIRSLVKGGTTMTFVLPLERGPEPEESNLENSEGAV